MPRTDVSADILDEMVTAGGVIWLGALLFDKLRRYGETLASAFLIYMLTYPADAK